MKNKNILKKTQNEKKNPILNREKNNVEIII